MGPQRARTQKSRGRSLMQGASNKLTRLNNWTFSDAGFFELDKESRLRISAPFNFRNMSDASIKRGQLFSMLTVFEITSEPIPRPGNLTSIPKLRKKQSNDQHLPISPLEKPLPSLPCLTIHSSSPLKPNRSLIDAEEKPLRRSLSPEAQNYEDWPSLSPQKQRSVLTTTKVHPTTTTKPSLTESLYEGMKNLKIGEDMYPAKSSSPKGAKTDEPQSDKKFSHSHPYEDLQADDKTVDSLKRDVMCKAAAIGSPGGAEISSPVFPTSPPLMPLPVSASKSSSIKTRTPQIRHTKTSEMRLRMLAEHSEEHKIAGRHSSTKTIPTRRDDSLRTKAMLSASCLGREQIHTKSRSRSRHRVTSQGSPHASPGERRTDRDQGHDINNFSAVKSVQRKMQTGSHNNAAHAPDVFAIRSTRSPSRHGRKRSLSQLTRHAQELLDEGDESEVTIQNASHKSLAAVKKDNSSDGDVDTDRDHDEFVGLSPLSPISIDHNPFLKYKNSAAKLDDTLEAPNSAAGGAHSDRKQRLTPSNITYPEDVSPDIGDEKTFRVKFLSRVTPGRGPVLRISPSADSIILGKDFGNTCDVSKRDGIIVLPPTDLPDHVVEGLESLVTQSSKVVSQQPHLNIASGRKPQPAKDSISSRSGRENSLSSRIASDGKNIGNEFANDEQGNDDCKAKTKIWTGKSTDEPSPIGWPFREPIVTPSKTFTTPECDNTCSSDPNENTRKDSAVQASSTTSPGMSIRSRYNINEALSKIQPVEKRAEDDSAQASKNASTQEARAVSLSFNAIPIPPRNPLRQTNSARTTGYRTPSNRPPPRPADNSTKLHIPPPVPQNVKPRVPNTAQSASRSRNTNNRDEPRSSPMPHTTTISTGKGVIQNIRQLFHKRSDLQSNLTASIHNSAQQARGSILRRPTHVDTPTLPASTKQHLPRSPQVKRTSSLCLRPRQIPLSSRSSLSPRVFPEHQGVRLPAKTQPSNPVPPTDENLPTKPIRNTNPTPDTLSSATALAHHLLTLATTSTSPTRKTELIESSKLLVTTLNLARDSEKSLEEARQALAKCELAASGIRAQVAKVEGLVRDKVGTGE